MAITLDGIYVDGQKATFRPEDILSGDASAYTEEIGTAVEEWLEENVTGGEQVTDTTLALPGVPADAKATGNKIDELKEDLSVEIAQTNSRFSVISDKLTVRKTVSGTSFSITDCAKSGEVDAAEVEQSGAYVYVGGNMLPAAASASKTHRGITVTSNGDGTYHISGTSTGSSKVSFDLPETFTIQAGMYIHLLNSEQVNSSSIAFGDSDGQISGGYVGFVPKERIFQVLSTSSLIGKTITTIFVSIGITEAVDFTIAPMLLWDSEEKDYSGYYPEVAYAEGEGLALNVGYNHIRTSAGSVAITYSVAGEDFVTKPIMAETLDSYAEKADVPELIADYEKSTILTRNRDIIPLIDACTKSAHNAGGQSNVGKRFSLLVMTDTHGDYERVENAIDYLNAMPQIDAGIHLGDIVASNWASAYEWFETAVQKSEKPFYIALGNHDGLAKSGTTIGASVTEQFNRYIYPNLNKIGSTDITKTYYAIKNDTYKVVLIVLHLYDVPSTQSGGEYVISRGMPAYSQAQVDWLIDTLASVPTNYHVMIAQHCVYEPVTADNNEWRNIDSDQLISPGYNYTNMIAEIVKAWINGESHTATYTAQTSGLPNITVNANFLTRGAGVFAGYLIGHTHRDQTGVLTEYPDQHYYCFDTSANDTYQTEWSDLPRHIGTKSEDCISVVSIDTDKKRVCLVRVGSNRTFDMTNRDKCVISYE